jgi:hypothetical protein
MKLRTSGIPPRKSATRNAEHMVFVSEDGNCFLQGDSNRTHFQHEGHQIISQDRIDEWQNIIKLRYSGLSYYGIPYLFLLGPDKQSIFWESIHPGKRDNRNSLFIFNDKLNGATWIDPVPALKEAAKAGSVCALTDGHWDARGAYVAYREVISQISFLKNDLLIEGRDFVFTTKNISGDLGNKFVPIRFAPANTLKKINMSSRRIYANGVDRNGQCHIYRKKELNNVGVLCGDSYTQSLAPFFAEHFGIFVHLRGSTDLDFLYNLKPDLVIGSLAERFFVAEPVSNDAAPIEMFFIRRLCHSEMKPDVYRRIRSELSDDNLPPPLLAMVGRNDALGDMLISTAPTERQRKFMGNHFIDATSGDVLTACYLSWVWQTPLAQSWADALSALPNSVQSEFRTLCPLG